MTAWSKVLTCSCYELGHTWEPSCRKAIAEVARQGYKEAFKIYLPLYLIAALLKKRNGKYYATRLLPEVLRSSLFLGTNAFSFIGFFCLWRKLLGMFTLPSTAFLPSMCASLAGIVFERHHRRTQLAVYMSNVATETVWRMLANRKLVKPIPSGEVLLFCAVSSVYLYLYKCKDGLPKSTANLFKFLMGESEMGGHTGSASESHDRPASPRATRPTSSPLSYLPRDVQNMVHNARQGGKHSHCRHRHGCVATTVERFLRMFGIGYSIQAVLKLIRALGSVFRNPRGIFRALFNKDNAKLGAFLGFYAAIYQGVCCALRHLRDKDSDAHGLVAGFLAGGSMMFWKSTTLAMFAASKLAETLYMKGIEKGVLPYIRFGEILVYTVSTSIVFHAAVFEPHSLRPAYWKFLLQMTNGRFADMNRQLLDIYGTHASKLMPHFWPDYDPRYSSLTLDSVKEMIRQATSSSS